MLRKTPRFERALTLRDLALKLLQRSGQWEHLRPSWPERKVYNDDRFSIGFYVRPPEGVLCGLYTLDLWYEHKKVLSLTWHSAGADPNITNFRRGEWEPLFLDVAHKHLDTD
jgi:hypothetical protein